MLLTVIKAANSQSMFHTEEVKNIYFPLLMSPRWLWHVRWLCACSSTRQTGLRSPNLNPRRAFEVNRFTLYYSILLCRLWQRHRKTFISTSIIPLIPSRHPSFLFPTTDTFLFLFLIFYIQLNNYSPDIC